jgi:hypothetical protein
MVRGGADMEKLIPGVIALVFGIVFTIYWRTVVQAILDWHHRFWGQTFKLSGEVGSFGQLFLNALILILGAGFILAGLTLIYRSVR